MIAFLVVFAVAATSSDVPQAASSEPLHVTGRAFVVDGDTLQVGRTLVRLAGLDAPEIDQNCCRDRRYWPCGLAARSLLREAVYQKDVTCRIKGVDQYGRSVGDCSTTVDLGGQLLDAGLAVVWRPASAEYLQREAQARSVGRGVWAGEFSRPYEHRQQQKRSQRTPLRCPKVTGDRNTSNRQ